jgi:hypothetical protein
MKNALLVCTCFFITALSFSVPALSQERFDIAMEGPWIFYHENHFQLTDGATTTTYDALIAVAPQVPGHYPLVFSSGNGLTYDPGVYCVGFDQACMTSLTEVTPTPNDPYVPPQFVPIKQGNWDWKNLPAVPAAYVLIIPWPNSWSSDGQYDYSLMSSFPASIGTHLPTPQHAAIGVQLHYDVRPGTLTNFNLSACTKLSSAYKCDTPQAQANSDTLRISIKSPDDLPGQLQCDHHVHRAYHCMTKLIDLASNSQSAYLLDSATFTEECRRCDPQLGSIPEDCSSGPHMMMTATVEDVLAGLDAVVSQLGVLQPADVACPNKLYQLCELQARKNDLAGKAANLSTLLKVEDLLDESQSSLNAVLMQDEKKAGNSHTASGGMAKIAAAKSKTQIEVALDLEKWLAPTLVTVLSSSTNGKDCRVSEMFVQ